MQAAEDGPRFNSPEGMNWSGIVTLSQTDERNLPTIANVDARDFSDLACWLIVQIGPISINVTTPFEDMDAKAFWHDLKFSLKHLGDFSRCAIVSDVKWLSLWSAIVEPFIDCEVAYFPPDQVEVARDWLLWPEGAADVL